MISSFLVADVRGKLALFLWRQLNWVERYRATLYIATSRMNIRHEWLTLCSTDVTSLRRKLNVMVEYVDKYIF